MGLGYRLHGMVKNLFVSNPFTPESLPYTWDVVEGIGVHALTATAVRGGFAEAYPKQARKASARGEGGGDSLQLSPEAQKQIAELKRRDQEVRAHEAAHLAAGGGVVRGGASYTYQVGPDGKSYAVGGEVTLDTSPVPDDPRATIRKAEQIKAAALAPAQPSAQDRQVAAAAAAMEAAAAAELAQQGARSMGRVDVSV